MNVLLYLIPPVAVVAMVALAVKFRHPSPRRSDVNLSLAASQELKVVETVDLKPFGVDAESGFILSFCDTWSIYWDSRKSLTQANQFALGNTNREIAAYVEREERTHRNLVRTLRRALWSRSAMYTRAALWLYVEERAIMIELSDCYAETQSTTGAR